MPDNLVQLGQQFGEFVAFAVIAVFFMWIAKLWRDWRTPFDDNDLVDDKKNMAVGIRRAGLYLGIVIGMMGALAGPSMGFVRDVLTLLVEGAIVLVCLLVAQFINDKVILHSVNNNGEVEKGNSSIGLIELGSYVATGLILNGSFSGEGGEAAASGAYVLEGVPSALAFFALGQIVLVIVFLIYELITPFNVREEILDSNNAAGLAAAGMFIALGIILRASIAGPFVNWANDLASFGISAAFGIVLLLVFRKVIDWLFLPHTSLAIEVHRDRNVAAIALAQGAIIAVALIIGAAI